MADLYHVVIKDHDNSGYVWNAFFCLDCLKSRIMNGTGREILRSILATPRFLSRLYPPLVDEPICSECGDLFTY